jgi:trk system potassium uptake protein TrkA
LKNGDMIKPNSQSKIEEGDIIALFVLSKDIPQVERLLQVTIDYF